MVLDKFLCLAPSTGLIFNGVCRLNLGLFCVSRTPAFTRYLFACKYSTTTIRSVGLAFVEGSVPPVKPVAPVIIYWGTKDTAVPPVMHQIYQKQMCAMGANVGRIQLPGEQTHFTTPGVSAPMYLQWVKDRIAGKPVANGCPTS